MWSDARLPETGVEGAVDRLTGLGLVEPDSEGDTEERRACRRLEELAAGNQPGEREGRAVELMVAGTHLGRPDPIQLVAHDR